VASVTLQGVSKRFGATRAVDRVSLTIAEGEFFALLGPSGCGKTTLLRLVAGFETPDDGEIRLKEQVVGRAGWALPPERRRIGMVFQSYALWPHMSVAENVAFSLRVRRVPAAERVRRVEAALAMVGLDAMAERRPHELSGGQRQRVALARCSPCSPRSCCSTNRSPISTCICARRCSRSSHASTGRSARPSSTSPMIRPRRWRLPTASP
jgi:iron(III) transport system ATP-binding protein